MPNVCLRTVCNANDPIDFVEHKHLCKNCNTCWKHSNAVQHESKEDNRTAHTCPNCGEEEYWKHFTNEDKRRLDDLTPEDVRSLYAMLSGTCSLRERRVRKEITEQYIH